MVQTCIKLAGAKQSDVDARARSVECLLAQDVRKGIKYIEVLNTEPLN